MRLPASVRRALSIPVRHIPVRISGGPNKGSRWSLPVSGRGISAGVFETTKFEALAALISEGDVFWDVGAHYGYASLVGVRAAGRAGRVLAFEPSAHNRWFLNRHLQWNDATSTQVLPFALADADGMESFGGSTSSSVAQKLGEGKESVEVRSFDSLLADGLPCPTVVKIDIEGAESRALAGAREALSAMSASERPSIMCAVHDSVQFESCVEALKSLGYRVFGAGWFTQYLAGSTGWLGDPDLLALMPGRSETVRLMRGTVLFRDGPEL